MINFFKKLWEKYVIYKYFSIGVEGFSPRFWPGSNGSYWVSRDFTYWKKHYKKLGYKPVDYKTWILIGEKFKVKVYEPKIVIRDSGASEWVNSAEYFSSEDGQEFLKESNEFAERYIEKNDRM